MYLFLIPRKFRTAGFFQRKPFETVLPHIESSNDWLRAADLYTREDVMNHTEGRRALIGQDMGI
jgi:hypothetical protein